MEINKYSINQKFIEYEQKRHINIIINKRNRKFINKTN